MAEGRTKRTVGLVIEFENMTAREAQDYAAKLYSAWVDGCGGTCWLPLDNGIRFKRAFSRSRGPKELIGRIVMDSQRGGGPIHSLDLESPNIEIRSTNKPSPKPEGCKCKLEGGAITPVAECPIHGGLA